MEALFFVFYLLLLCRYIVFFNEPFTDQISRCSSISWRQRQRFSVLIVQTGDSISLAVIVLSQKSFEVCLSRLWNPYFFGGLNKNLQLKSQCFQTHLILFTLKKMSYIFPTQQTMYKYNIAKHFDEKKKKDIEETHSKNDRST